MTWETTEREGRRDTEASLVCRDFLDLQVQQESRELQESSDQEEPGDLQDPSGPTERKGTSDSPDPWALLELED